MMMAIIIIVMRVECHGVWGKGESLKRTCAIECADD